MLISYRNTALKQLSFPKLYKGSGNFPLSTILYHVHVQKQVKVKVYRQVIGTVLISLGVLTHSALVTHLSVR